MEPNGTVICLVGLGLIGSSLAKAIKAASPSSVIIGYDQLETITQACQSLAIIDEMAPTFEAGASQAEVIILCTPVQITVQYLDILQTIPLKRGVIITDVGSSKRVIMESAARLIERGICFSGGYPMAGSHKAGYQAADVNLFENALYVLIPPPNAQVEVSLLKELLAGTRAHFIQLEARQHDEITGMVSHLPHIMAASLVNQVAEYSEKEPLTEQLAAGGFRDLTRIASSDPQMWTEISLTNQAILLEQLADWQTRVTRFMESLAANDELSVYQFFQQAKQTRDALPKKNAGVLPGFHDLFVEVPDYPGVIADVTRSLAAEKLSLTNLKILENREDIFGTLQLTFKYAQDVQKGKAILKSHYRCYEKE